MEVSKYILVSYNQVQTLTSLHGLSNRQAMQKEHSQTFQEQKGTIRSTNPLCLGFTDQYVEYKVGDQIQKAKSEF